MAKRSCSGSGEVLDDTYRPWRYPEGIRPVKCSRCGAVRKPVVRQYTLGGRGGCHEDKLIFPYHQRVEAEPEKKRVRCTNCRGRGEVRQWGMFPQAVGCEDCGGKGYTEEHVG